MKLVVLADNTPAVNLYQKFRFSVTKRPMAFSLSHPSAGVSPWKGLLNHSDHRFGKGGKTPCPGNIHLSPGSDQTKNHRRFTAAIFLWWTQRIRTLDLSDANRTLSQLSYEPIFHCRPNYYIRKNGFVKWKGEKFLS